MRTLVVSVVLLQVAALVCGCATPSKPEAMVVTPAQAVHKSPESVSVSVSGGKETSSTSTSQISDAAFAQALRESIQKSGLFAAVKEGGTYRLDAYIGKVAQPMLGFDLKVDMEVGYTLVDSRTGRAVLRKNIPSSYTATTGDAFVAVERLRLANEGAARANIDAFLREVSLLNLD